MAETRSEGLREEEGDRRKRNEGGKKSQKRVVTPRVSCSSPPTSHIAARDWNVLPLILLLSLLWSTLTFLIFLDFFAFFIWLDRTMILEVRLLHSASYHYVLLLLLHYFSSGGRMY